MNALYIFIGMMIVGATGLAMMYIMEPTSRWYSSQGVWLDV